MIEEWTEKYRPRSLKDIVGNDMAVRTIKRWADSWRVGVPRIKALVLRGEPGTGKTSAALALAKDMGWDSIEMNASDHRNAESIKNVAGAGSAYQTFTASGEFLSSDMGKRKLIILDEADNLFGREDKGGAKAIAETIRESGQPIILIVNDYYTLTRKTPAIKTLAESVTFRRLSAQEVTRVLGSVVANEGRTAPAEVLGKIAENAGGDLRAAINDLQMMLEGRVNIEASDSGALGKRNQEKELNSTLRAMFISDTVRGARDATFDLDMTPDELLMWVEESVPREIRDPSRLAKAFDAVSRSDIYLARTRMLQHYGLWAYAKEMMTGGVALARVGETGPRPQEYRFPGALIVLSRAKGARQERNAVATKLALHMHTNRRRIADSTLPYLSILVRRDEELLIELGKVLDFEESDIAHLLGLEHDSARVKRLAELIARGKAGAEDTDDWSKGRKPLKGKRGKTGF
jgi:replication factor C large subunit